MARPSDQIEEKKPRKSVTFFGAKSLDSSINSDEDSRSPLLTKAVLRRIQRKFIGNYASINSSVGESVSQSIMETSNNYAETLHQDDDEFLSSKYESLDYDKIFNEIDVREDPIIQNISRKQLARWVVMFFVGVLTAVVAVIINYIVETVSSYKYSLIAEGECTSKHCLWRPLAIWIGSNMGLCLMSALLVVFLSPASRGSGIPVVKCYLNGIKIPQIVRIKTLIAKMFGISFAVSGGLACGKEGPMIHSGAIIAAGISQGLSTSLGFDLKIFKYFRSDQEKRDFVSGGAAAGVAAAFGAPVGGVLFSLEEGASFWNQGLTWRIVKLQFFGSMVSSFTLNVIISLIRGHFGDLSNPGLINFGKFQNVTYQSYEIPIFILTGAFAGLLGALFNHINIKLTRFRSVYVRRKLSTIIECLLVAAISAIVGFILSFYFATDCQPIGRDLVSKYPVQLFCNDGQYNAMSGLFFQTPEASVRSLFHDPPGSFNPITLLVFCIAYYILAVWTYGLAIPGGLFIPSLLIGASWGRLVGIGIGILFPNAQIQPGKYALIGAASTLAGIMRMTLSLTIIITEATGDISLGLPIMFSMMAAKLVGDLFNEGLFDMHIQLSGIPLLDWNPPPTTERLNAQRIMTHPVVVFREIETVGHVYDVLSKTTHNGFPVVEGFDPDSLQNETFGLLKGLILRHQLLTLLKKKTYLNNDIRLKPEDFREYYPRYISVNDIQLSDEEKQYAIDLRPYMNLAPYSLTENSNLPRLFRLFRGLGLRHLVIVDLHNRVVGIVTRIDLARYRAHVGFKTLKIKELLVTA